MIFKLFFLLLVTTSCCHKLSVRSEYLTEASLASYHVETPDPRRGCPFFGQQLIISWRIPSALWHNQEIVLDVTIRFRNNEERRHKVRCDRSLGTYLYIIKEEEYAKLQGILTYKIILLEDGDATEEWIHPLWQERIVI